jgi:hypothetical protein
VTAAIGVAADREFQRPDWRVVAHMLGATPATGRVILVQHYRDLLPLSLYEQGLRFHARRARRHAAWRRHDLQFSVLDLRSSRPVLLDRALASRALTATALQRDGLLIQR